MNRGRGYPTAVRSLPVGEGSSLSSPEKRPDEVLATPRRAYPRKGAGPMRRQDKSTPPVPPLTHGEDEAQSSLRRALELLWFVEFFLDLAYDGLPDPPNAEAMGTGEIPE